MIMFLFDISIVMVAWFSKSIIIFSVMILYFGIFET